MHVRVSSLRSVLGSSFGTRSSHAIRVGDVNVEGKQRCILIVW